MQFCRVLQGILTRPEYDIVYTPHIGTSLIILKSDCRYNLLIIDLELDGKRKAFEFAETTRSMIHRAHLPIVVIANETVDDVEVLARYPAIDACLFKENVSACCESMKLLLENAPKAIGYPLWTPPTRGYADILSEQVSNRSRPYKMTLVLHPRLGFHESE